jgi:ribosomal protein S18 acetylase RimI-like enzyme
MSHVHRPVSSDDADALGAFVAGIRPSDRTFLDDQLLDPDRVAAWATDPTATGLVAVDGERILAVGSLRPGSGWTSHVGVLRVVVGEVDRGGGVGRTLVLALLGVAAQRGVAKVVVEVMAANVAAARLFERLGFVAEATLRDHVRDARGNYQDLTVLTTWIDHEGRPVESGEEIAG